MANQKLKNLNAIQIIAIECLIIIFLLIVGVAMTAKTEDVTSSEVKIEAMVVEFSYSELSKVGIDYKLLNIKDAIGLDSGKIQTLENKIQSGEIKGEIISFPTLQTIIGEEASANLVLRKIHYMERIDDNLYKLKAVNSGLTFKVIPFVEDSIITLSIDLQIDEILERQDLSEAPDLDVGIPLTTSRRISTTVSLKNGETMLINADYGKEIKERVYTLILLTAGIDQ